jgi:hypothetical protein
VIGKGNCEHQICCYEEQEKNPIHERPAVLAFTGVFICCRRVIFKKRCKPERHAD